MRRLFLTLTLLLAASPLAAQDPADSAWNAGAHDRARVLYGQRVTADSSDEQALHRLGLLLAWNREYADAVRLLDRLLVVAPGRSSQLDRANVLAWSGDYARAVAALDELLAADSADLDLWAAKARYLSWSRRYDESLAVFARLSRLQPEDTAIAHAHARVLSWAGHFGDSEDIYRALLQREPGDAEALRGLARVTSWQGDLGGGERLWREAVSAEPDNAEARLGLSQVLRWQGQSRAALAEAEAALTASPGSRDAEIQLAWSRAAFRPRMAPSFVAEFDSEDNRILTTGLTVSGYLGQRVALAVQGYLRRADDAAVTGWGSESRSAALSLRADVFRAWVLGVSGGLLDRPDQATTTATAAASLASPAWRAVSGSVTLSRAMLDGTARLIENGVRADEVLVSMAARFSPAVRLDLSGAVAEYRGAQQNQRLLARVGLEARASRWLRVRPRFTTFGFDKDLAEGYFDPESYRLGELGIGLDRYRDAWGVSAEVAPGAQQVGSDGQWQGAVSARARVQYTVAPGRDIGLGFHFSNYGIERHQSENADYRYRAAVLSGGWTF